MVAARPPPPRRVVVVGNPNSGKSALFNALTGLRQKVGNYPGVTVERRTGQAHGLHGEPLELVDLPGLYSLEARSPDEAVAVAVLRGEEEGASPPDLILAVVDASRLERSLFLLSQVLELGRPVVLALNMVDEAERSGWSVDVGALSAELGIPVIPTVATEGRGLVPLRQALGGPLSPPRPRLASTGPSTAEGRFRSIEALLPRVIRRAGDANWRGSDRIDAVVTHPVLGWLAFLGVMACLFLAIFSLAEIPKGWIEAGVGALASVVEAWVPEGDARSLLIDGVLAGVGGVLVFLPQILLLFLFLGLLEDSGYLARAAFIVDRLMRTVGLQGRSFVPLLSSFACAIPGVMAARTIDDPRDRLVTILIAPLMSCSARLPVYTLLVPVALGPLASPGLEAAATLGLYLTGMVGAFAVAWLLRRTVVRGGGSMLLLELPPYRRPRAREVLLGLWDRGGAFVRRAGTVILALSILIWAASTYPKPSDPEATPDAVLEHSLAGRMGRWIEPAIEPLGYDWRIGVALLASFAAREVFVSTIAILYRVETDEPAAVAGALSAATRPDGSAVYTPLTCLSLLVFYVFALQCLSTVVIVRRETNSWRWPAFQLAYMTVLAYGAALAVRQVGGLLGWS